MTLSCEHSSAPACRRLSGSRRPSSHVHPQSFLWLCELFACTALVAVCTGAQTACAASRTPYVIDTLSAWNAGLDPAVRTEKYTAMAANLFAFYRGSAQLFWKDQGTAAALASFGGVAATRIWLQGDAHTDNFGSFANDRGAVVYDLNDFDEAVLGDYQLDLWRLGASLVLIMRDSGKFTAAQEAAVVDACTENYLDTVESWSSSAGETTKTYTQSNTYGQLDDFLADVAASRSQSKLLDKYTSLSGAGVRFLDPAVSPDLQAVPAATATAVSAQMASYGATLSGKLAYSASAFKVKSVALRVHAGLGSLGATRYYVLIEGPTTGQDDDVILDLKVQGAPSAYLNLAASARAATDAASGNSPARRVVAAAKALGNYVDDYLGWMTLAGQVYSVRQRSPWKDTLDTAKLTSIDRMTKMAEQWGAILATAHCRADQDANATNVPYDFDSELLHRINGKHDTFRAAVRAVVLPYADQVADDYKSFLYGRAHGSL